jgi:hypothetical protein
MHLIVEYAGKCDYCQRSLAKAGRSYTSFKCNGILVTKPTLVSFFFFFFGLAKKSNLFLLR